MATVAAQAAHQAWPGGSSITMSAPSSRVRRHGLEREAQRAHLHAGQRAGLEREPAHLRKALARGGGVDQLQHVCGQAHLVHAAIVQGPAPWGLDAPAMRQRLSAFSAALMPSLTPMSAGSDFSAEAASFSL